MESIKLTGGRQLPVKVKKVTPDARVPMYQSKGSAGFDLHAYIGEGEGDTKINGYKEAIVINPGKRRLISTALCFQIADGYEMQLRPRSGLALNHGITLTNSPATIDSDYTGEVKIILENRGDKVFVVADNDRIAQAVIAPIVQATFEEVDELSSTERGTGGFGSTGVVA